MDDRPTAVRLPSVKPEVLRVDNPVTGRVESRLNLRFASRIRETRIRRDATIVAHARASGERSYA